MLSDIHRRVVNAKYVLERAARIQAESNEMSLSISLLLMHDAIELLMLAVLDHLKVNTNRHREFMDFWQEIKRAGLPEPPDSIPMDSLNKLRVALKHNGILPNPQTVRNLLPRTRGFFENVLNSYCQMAYAEISLTDLIPDPEVREIVAGARQKFEAGDKPSAMTDLKIALHKLENPDGKYLPKLHAPQKPSLSYEMNRAGWGTYLNQIHSFLDQCASRTNALMFGIDPIRYANFVRSGPGVAWAMTGTPYVSHWSKYDEVTSERFDELVSFLIDYALKVSEAYIPLAVRNLP
jgi:hypothetical protein